MASTYNGSTTTTNSYWTPETTGQQESKAGIKKNIQAMLYKTGYISWDFNNIWSIVEESSIAYLKNTAKPNQVNKENINYIDFGIEGKGTAMEPYIIKTAVQLQKLNENLEAYYKLGANIDLTGVTFTSIGNQVYPFKGTLDGNGYIISNLTLNNNENNVGLFGYNQGTLKNIKTENFNITGGTNVGALSGYNIGTITNCNVGNGSVSGTTNVGGLIGTNIEDITGNTSMISVQGTTNVGGLIGYLYANNRNITIESSGASGNVQGTTNVGGLVGNDYIYHTYGVENTTYNMYIKKCYASRKCNRSRRQCRWISWKSTIKYKCKLSLRICI